MQAIFNQKSVPNWLNLSSPETIVVSIVKRFRDQKPPFEERINVEDWVPDYYTDENRARFIFFTTAVDYGMRSPILYRAFWIFTRWFNTLIP